MAKLNVKKGDKVVVLAGKDKGKSGKVIAALPQKNRVVVENVNIHTKHKKARNAQEKSGIEKMEASIDASNVQVICPVCGKATRVAHKIEGDKKERICKKCGASLDGAKKSSKAKKATAETKVATEEKKAPEAKVQEVKAEVKKAPAKKTTTEAKKAPAKKSTAAAKKPATQKSSTKTQTTEKKGK